MTSHAGLDPARDADILIEQGEHTREGAADANPFRDGEGDGGSSSRAVQDLASKSPVQIAVRRLAYDKIAMMSLGVVLLFVILGIFAETINSARGVDPVLQDTTFISPGGYPTFTASPEHPFGIETGTGRDLLARWLIGIRPSLIIAVVAATAVTIIGTALGLLAGYLGGIVDNIVSFIIDVVQSLPFLLFAIALVPIAVNRLAGSDGGFISDDQVADIRFGVLIVVLIIFGWTGLARLVRGEVISIREREYVQAARALGVPTSQILSKEILPNLLSPIIVSLTTAIPAFISAEAGLSLLGVGLREPSVSWGLTIQFAQNSFMQHPLYMWMPVIGLSMLVLALSLLGDAVNDAFNPHTRR
ncbi:ABC transporter permease [Kytococcus sedentarius]|uniref:ABC-type dipeptide/oligopeptide/nickel transport system, permease component n=1 Tax=Kytococcus sedentarius (strain ATCC 14392 / DSM 20547 / JCM 11482 / CCUG 33030 / NBRC 15357 / NCTC 11040 / CCM 314 / 541) TaxID=478801 RepID=C7NHC1_KYTSD|nr:ABC transporter permease [Kytococcus sedentarius]ACV06278.1 ABC-type dipeptide/oligopeptide/nickel transport system, permease component [Kytococcus sedentarius DSM 20547]STX12303.1 Oligopeptide transport system permease protein oppC [Kytococcus sedentarius]